MYICTEFLEMLRFLWCAIAKQVPISWGKPALVYRVELN